MGTAADSVNRTNLCSDARARSRASARLSENVSALFWASMSVIQPKTVATFPSSSVLGMHVARTHRPASPSSESAVPGDFHRISKLRDVASSICAHFSMT